MVYPQNLMVSRLAVTSTVEHVFQISAHLREVGCDHFAGANRISKVVKCR
jgi:hypothetical protein